MIFFIINNLIKLKVTLYFINQEWGTDSNYINTNINVVIIRDPKICIVDRKSSVSSDTLML